MVKGKDEQERSYLIRKCSKLCNPIVLWFPCEKSHAYLFYSIYLVSSSTPNCRRMSFTLTMAHVNFIVQAEYSEKSMLDNHQFAVDEDKNPSRNMILEVEASKM